MSQHFLKNQIIPNISITTMRYITWILCSINIYLGLRCFLNTIHVLQTSKYSQSATVIFAILFLGMGIGGFYMSLVNHNDKLAMLISIGPWLIALLILLLNMLTGNYK